MAKFDGFGFLGVVMLTMLFVLSVGYISDKITSSPSEVVFDVPVGTIPDGDGWRRYQATVDRVVDGDTVDVVVDLGFDLSLRGRFRLAGIDAPEMNTAAGRASKARLEELLPAAGVVFVETFKGDAKDKYGRYLGKFVQADGKSDIGEVLVREGRAKVYWPK